MEKFLSTILAVLLVASIMLMGAFNITANAQISDYYTYTIENGEATITGIDKSISGNITIPSTLGGYPVTKIDDWVFYDCDKLTKITLPNGIKKIGSFSFNNCDALDFIVLPKSLTEIGYYAFKMTLLNTVYYGGCESDKAKIIVDDGNSALFHANWIYTHTYTHNCDISCNVCEATRTITHAYKTITTNATLTQNGKAETKCTVCGYISESYVIYSPKTIKLSATTVTYNGKVRTPSVIVKDSKGKTLVKGTDYKVTVPSGRKLPGIYKYTITFMGKYSGTKTLDFTILPKAPTTISATQTTSTITLNWSESAGATGYRVYQYSPSKGKYVQVASVKGVTSYKKTTNFKAGTEYSFKVKPYTKLADGTVLWGVASEAFVTATKCNAPSITSVVSPSKSKATVKWSNVGGETGYQLYYATSKNGTYKKINSYGADVLTGTKTFSASASGKTIYFKVRAYHKVNGQTIFGNWSAIKSVKLK